jgi:hypothetical protein
VAAVDAPAARIAEWGRFSNDGAPAKNHGAIMLSKIMQPNAELGMNGQNGIDLASLCLTRASRSATWVRTKPTMPPRIRVLRNQRLERHQLQNVLGGPLCPDDVSTEIVAY